MNADFIYFGLKMIIHVCVICFLFSSVSYCYKEPIVKFRLNIVRTDLEPLAEHSRRSNNDNADSHKNYTLVSKPALRILGGNVSDVSNHPYVAAILIHGRLWCAGAIVDVNWVLTAAHCLNYVILSDPLRSLREYVKVRVGSTRALEGGALVDIVGAVRHPKFEEEPVPHADIALLKLEEQLTFSNSIRSIKIFEGYVEPYAQSFILVSGWGATKASGEFEEHSSDLLSARLKVRTQSYCEDAYQLVSGFRFTEDFFCASLRNGTRDACLFDAGAPAVQNERLMGLLSFGPQRCGDEVQPPVFIKAYYFRDFVATTIASYKEPEEKAEAIQEARLESTMTMTTNATTVPAPEENEADANLPDEDKKTPNT